MLCASLSEILSSPFVSNTLTIDLHESKYLYEFRALARSTNSVDASSIETSFLLLLLP